MISFGLIAAYGLFAILLYFAHWIYYQFTYWRNRKMLFIESVPIIGNNGPILTGSCSISMHIHNLYEKFPNARYYGLFEFKQPEVMVKDPELIREICVKSFDNFTDHDAFVTEEMDPIAGRNVFSLMGQRWRDLRHTLSPSYTASRMKLLFDLIAECSNEFVQYFVQHPEVAKNFESKEAFTRYTNDVIATAAFGVKVNSMVNPKNEFFMHGQASSPFSKKSQIAKFLLLKSFPRLMRFFGMTFFPKSTDIFFKKLIRDTIKLREEKGIIRPDMLQLLIQAMKKEDDIKIDIDDITAQSFIFFIAGFDTSSSLMSFIVHELAAHPEIQEKLHEEIDKHFNDDTDITYDSLGELKYLDMIINETLRKYPAAPITNRVCVKDFTFPPPMEGYPEYRMEKGTVIVIPIYSLHHNPEYFPEPDKFIPERFSDENKSKINPYTYMPFGLGPRKCIGNRFALMETKIVIANIFRKFVVKLTDKSTYPVKFSKRGFNLGTDHGLWVKFEERKKSN